MRSPSPAVTPKRPALLNWLLYSPLHADDEPFQRQLRLTLTPSPLTPWLNAAGPAALLAYLAYYLRRSHPADLAFEGQVFQGAIGLGPWYVLVRMAVKAEVLLGICAAITEALGTATQPLVQTALADATVYLETLRALIQTAEAHPVRSASGLALPNPTTALAGRICAIEHYPRLLQIIRELCGSGLLMAPGQADLQHPEIGPYLEGSDRVVRPANTSRSTPGRGLTVIPASDGGRLAVINVLGSLFLHPATSMFEVIDDLVDEARQATPVILVDVHAEATSEKVALAHWLDGRVTAVVGTHTHVQTADARVLPKGTAFITDAGMTGPHLSVIGVEAELAIRRMRTGMPVRFQTAQGDVRIEGALVECDAATGRASSIEAVRVPVP